MPELEEVVQKIMLSGDTEILHKFAEITETGIETFKELEEAAAAGASGFLTSATAIAAVATAIVGLAGALTAYTEAGATAIQQTDYLAKGFGATLEQVTGLEAAFAAAGVSTKTFEAAAQRLTTTIAREWPAISTSIRTAGAQQEAAQDRVIATTLRVQEAQQNLGRVNEESSNRIQEASIHAQSAYTALQFAAQRAYSEMQRGAASVESADLSLEQAEARLATLQGRPQSAEEKKALDVKEASLAVDKARQSAADARLAQQEKQAEATVKQQQLEAAATEASTRQTKAIEEAQNARSHAELAVREAINARAEAEEKAQQIALRSIPVLKDAVNGIIAGQKDARSAIDLTQVSVQNLTKAIIASAATGTGTPTGYQVLIQLSRLLSSEQGKLIDSSQRLAIVQQLSQRGFSTMGVSASDLLSALSKGEAELTRYQERAKGSAGASEEAAHAAEEFKTAMENLTFSIDLVNRGFAAGLAPIFSKGLEAINESLTSSDGLLHRFVDGIQAIGAAIGFVITEAQKLFEAIDKAFGLEKGETLRRLIIVLTVAVAAFASVWFAIPAAIAVVVTAIGYVYENAEKIGEAIKKTWEAFKDNSVIKFLGSVLGVLRDIIAAMAKAGGGQGDLNAAPNAQNSGSDAGGGGQQGFRTGGMVNGPGSGTSDSISARLSNGEFVATAAAVKHYGSDFFHALNSMSLGSFASGGLVGTPTRLAGAGSVKPTSTLNLSIDGRSFPGLRGPANVVEDLTSFATQRRTSSAGNSPSWVR